MSPGLEAAIFYASVATLVGAAIRFVRAAVERNVLDRTAVFIACCGGVGLVVAIATFVTGPKTLLPF